MASTSTRGGRFAGLSAEQFGLLDAADAAYLRMYGPNAETEFMAKPLVPTLRLSRDGVLHIISDDLISLMLAPNPPVGLGPSPCSSC